MILYKDVMTYFDESMHVYGWILSILKCGRLKILQLPILGTQFLIPSYHKTMHGMMVPMFSSGMSKYVFKIFNSISFWCECFMTLCSCEIINGCVFSSLVHVYTSCHAFYLNIVSIWEYVSHNSMDSQLLINFSKFFALTQCPRTVYILKDFFKVFNIKFVHGAMWLVLVFFIYTFLYTLHNCMCSSSLKKRYWEHW